MEVTSGAPGITFRDEGEAALFADKLAEALKLGYGVRRAEPPWILRTAGDKLSAALGGSARFRKDAQVSARRGTGEFRDGPSSPLSDQPVRLSIREAAQLAQVSEGLMRRLCRRKDVQASGGNGSPWVVDIASLAAWISRRRREDNPEPE